jgi:hypothetical protein
MRDLPSRASITKNSGGSMSRKTLALVICTFAVSITALAGDHESAGYPCPLDKTLTCVMSALDNPRGLAFGPEGALYVAEAGHGAGAVTDPTTDPRCFAVGPATGCYGPTGAISRLWRGEQEQFATGLPSYAAPGKGNRAIGPADIAFMGRGHAYITIGLEGDPRIRTLHPSLPELADFASLAHVSASGEWHLVADVGQYQIDNNAAETDPYGILAEPGAHIITDAGANELLRIAANGEISLLATFPSRISTPPRPSFAPPTFNQTTDAVPTSVVVGPDGAYYIAELTGIPFVDKKANIYRLDPSTDSIPRTFTLADAFLTGFKMTTDISFAPDGTLYVVEYATGAVQQGGLGILVRIVPDKSQITIQDQYQKGTRSTILTGLMQATSVLAGPDGEVYITIRGAQAGQGEVVRFVPPAP